MQSIRIRNPYKQIIIFLVLILGSNQELLAQGKPSIKWGRFNLLASDTTWKYQSGIAKPEYFSPQFNDQDWQTVNTKYLNNISPASTNWSSIGVFRKKFEVPDSLKGRQAELFLNQFGASEIYMDGQLLCRLGNVTGKVNDHVIIQKGIPFKLDSLPSHVIVIYYSNHMNKLLAERYGLIGYTISLSPLSLTEGDDNHNFHHIIISIGIMLSFCLFFWFVFAFYSYRLASLISALLLTNFSFIFVGVFLRDFLNTELKQFLVGQAFWEIGFSCSFGWGLIFIYALYFKKATWRSWLVGSLMLISIILILLHSKWWFDITRVFILLYIIETWRILILGLLKKRVGFWILAIGSICNIIGLLTAIMDVFNIFPWYLTTTQIILGIATDLSFPLTLALHLAWEFGSANRDLRLQLLHVKDLSEKNLQQEQEKQRILSTQNEILDQQVIQRTSELNRSLEELKSTQAQLIQSEKMASLGELTAGIAHEIQNPLNFVNNFSEVSRELVDEMNAEIERGNTEDAKSISQDLKQNLEKINHHGNRAGDIVKGMLQHSRSSSGVKEPTDINALVDEYLRLAYHGLRAKDKSFNAFMKTDFDETIGNINVIPQDIGRVILNLITNAFYAVTEKRNASIGLSYEPTVTVSTKKSGSKILISVKDNGNGIPQKILDKIFQPFFTTKPTGQGTGLGLSLSYDIVKAHGGEISLDSIVGSGATFTIILPITL